MTKKGYFRSFNTRPFSGMMLELVLRPFLSEHSRALQYLILNEFAA